MINYLSKASRRRDQFVQATEEFSLKHRNKLCIMIDPETNTVVSTYKGFRTAVRNKGAKNSIRDLLVLKPEVETRDKALNQLFQELDGMFYGLAEQLVNQKLAKSGILEKAKAMFGYKDEKGNTKELISSDVLAKELAHK